MPACNSTDLANATQAILDGCQTEFTHFGISNHTVQTVLGAYPTAREVVCLGS